MVINMGYKLVFISLFYFRCHSSRTEFDCRDIDKCDEGLDDCDSDLAYRNLAGGYWCQCNNIHI